MTLIEVLVALAILGITVGAILSATLTTTGGSSVNSRISRMNALLSAFGESIKNLPYQTCALAGDYQLAFDQADNALGNDDQELRKTLNATMTVDNIVYQGSSICSSGVGTDSGVQTVGLVVEVSGRTLRGQVTKRNPAASNVPVTVGIEVERISPDGNPTSVWMLRSTSTSPNGLSRWEWWCDGAWIEGGTAEPSFPSNTGPDYFDSFNPTFQPSCSYPAPTTTGVLQTVGLRVTDNHNVTAIGFKTFELSTTPFAHNNPTAQITQDTSPDCTDANPCGINTPITWHSSGPEPPDATIVSWRWTFGDGSPPIVCVLTSPSCRDATSHEYEGGGTFVLSLTVTDSLGAMGTATRQIKVNAPPLVKPTVAFASTALGASITSGVAPQRVTFNGAGSYADGYSPGSGTPPGGITNYAWDFGDGQTQSGSSLVNPSHVFNSPGVYVVRLTVTAVNGATNYAETTITLTALQPPINLRNSGAHKADIPLIRDAYFDFQWVNPPRSPGDAIGYEIMISTASGFCSVVGWGMNGRVFSIPNGGAAGTSQTYRAQFGNGSWPPGVPLEMCSTDSYTFRGRTVRTNELGVQYSPWSDAQPLEADFF